MPDERTGPVDFPANVSRYGRAEPLPPRYPVRAGPLTAVVEDGDLRYIRLGNDLVILRLYGAVRDRNWGTIEPHFLAYELDRRDDGFTVRFVAENVSPLVDFEWSGEITGSADGTITATMDGKARKTFLRNRIGWCVLHPMDVAGVAATVETPGGAVSGEFPDLISADQPFLDMQAIRHGTPSGGEITIQFEGDLFEMEDQRNWTDASYKTYSTPLRIPYPAEIREGQRVWQRVTITARGEAAADTGDEPVRVGVDTTRAHALPPIGLTAASHGQPLSSEDIALLQALSPAHLHVTLDLTGDAWLERLTRAAADAAALGAALQIEAVAGNGGEGLEALADALSRSGAEVARVLVFSTGEMTTSEAVIDAAREAFARAGIATQIGGGSRAYFTELNRAELPLAAMDVVGYTLNPQVHAFDNASLTETLAAQAETVRSARAIVGDRPLTVGPVTLAPRFNPNATGPDPETPAGELPPSVDYRQPSLFAAGWLAGSINALANAGADALTFFETTGWKGLIERRDHPLRVAAFHSWPGMIFPAYHVLADVAEFGGGDVLSVAVSDPLRIQALALREDGHVRVILANMQVEPAPVALEVPGMGETRVRRLDHETVDLAASDAAAFRAGGDPLGEGGESIAIELPPFGLMTVDVEVGA